MYRSNENQIAQKEEPGREAVLLRPDAELEIGLLEERIARGGVIAHRSFGVNRSETMVDEPTARADVELDIQVLEERIAPMRIYSGIDGESMDKNHGFCCWK